MLLAPTDSRENPQLRYSTVRCSAVRCVTPSIYIMVSLPAEHDERCRLPRCRPVGVCTSLQQYPDGNGVPFLSSVVQRRIAAVEIAIFVSFDWRRGVDGHAARNQ